ncbi:MAG: hypothetical protein J2P26_11740 [Nocardiopsaceae bacterium]|nr:hypothetical protein [Nocardiopsaceae bacterium]
MGVPVEITSDLRIMSDQVREPGTRLVENATGIVNWTGVAAWRFRERMRRRLAEFEKCADLLSQAADQSDALIDDLEHPR